MRANSPFKPRRFTKSPGRKRGSAERIRLTAHEHQTFRRLVLGGDRAAPGRLRAWAIALDKYLVGAERVATTDLYSWLAYRVRRTSPMLFSDAAKIFVAGLRVHDHDFESPSQRADAMAKGEHLQSKHEWLTAVSHEVPTIQSFHYGHGVPGRSEGIYGKPFIPVMLPLEYVATLSEELAFVAVERDDGGHRGRVGGSIEKFFKAKLAPRNSSDQISWNSSASYAVEQIVMRVLFRDYYRGCFGEPGERLYSAVNEAGFRITRELDRTLVDPQPRAFERAFQRLGNDIARAKRVADN